MTDSKGKSFSCKYVIFYTESGGPNVGNSKAECSPNKDGGSVELMLSIVNYGDVRVKHFVRKNKDNIKSIVKGLLTSDFWLHQELKKCKCSSVCSSVCSMKTCLELSVFIFSAQIRSLSGFSSLTQLSQNNS